MTKLPVVANERGLSQETGRRLAVGMQMVITTETVFCYCGSCLGIDRAIDFCESIWQGMQNSPESVIRDHFSKFRVFYVKGYCQQRSEHGHVAVVFW